MNMRFVCVGKAGMTRLLTGVLFGMAVLAHATSVTADRPKVGLALSGGGAKGFAHVGVIKVLEEIGMPVDYITGTSMGSIIGGLHAAGYSAAELKAISLATDWVDLFQDRIERYASPMEQKRWDGRYNLTLPMEKWKVQLPTGLIAGQNLSQLFARLTLHVHDISDFRELPVPFACLAFDIVAGESVVLDHGHLAQAMRASMAIPSVFTPVEIGGRLLVDGGVGRNLPAQDVRDMGADIVIGIDVGAPKTAKEDLKSLLSILGQTVVFFSMNTSEEQRAQCDILITPEVSGFYGFSFNETAVLIEEGERAARALLPRLQALADSLNSLDDERRAPPARVRRIDRIDAVGVRVDNVGHSSRRLIETILNISPGWINVSEIEAAIERVYSTDQFARVTYRIEPKGHGHLVVVDVIEKSAQLFRLGVAYNTETDAAVLLNTTLRNTMGPGSTVSLDLRLSKELMVDGRYFVGSRFTGPFGIRLRGLYTETATDVYVVDGRITGYENSYVLGEAALGTIFSSRFLVAAGARIEYSKADPNAASGLEKRSDTTLPFVGVLGVDTVDRTVLPRKGVFVRAVTEVARDDLGSDLSFERYHLDGRAAIPLGGRFTVKPSIYLGSLRRDDPPPVYLFSLGGIDTPVTALGEPASFYGLDRRELSNENVQLVSVQLQYEFKSERFVILSWNAGNVFDEWNWNVEENRYINGGGITLAWYSPLGPIEGTLMMSEVHDLLGYFALGYTF